MKISKIFVSALILTILGTGTARSQSIFDLFGGSNGNGVGETIGNLLEGVFSSSNITIEDMAGEWTSSGPAVCFQGEGFLKKAGGIAGAAAIETKLAPYYEQYGLNNATMTVEKDGTFTLQCKLIKLNGTITRSANAEPGVFEFSFTALGMKLASVTTYVQKTSGSMDVMFDATKLKNLLSSIAKITNIKTVQAVTSILDGYDGLCVGFKFSKTGGNDPAGGSSIGAGLGKILGGFGSGSGTGTQSGTSTQSKTQNQSQSQSQNQNQSQNNTQNAENGNNPVTTGINILRGLLGK